MISRTTGEAAFAGLRIVPHGILCAELSRDSVLLPVAGWSRHSLGVYEADLGAFEIEVICDGFKRIQMVLMSHRHPFYDPNTPRDSERQAFHEGVISRDLSGQREFSWGEALCSFNPKANQAWLVLAYNREAQVPMGGREVLGHLYAVESERSSTD
jgi:hypothetical protein